MFPQLVRTFSSGSDKEFAGTVRLYLHKLVRLGGGLALFLAVFGGLFVSVIYGNQYLKSQALVPVFGIAAFFSFINNFIIYVMLAMRREKRLIVSLLLPASLSVVLGPTVVASTGTLGAACSLLLSRCTLTVVLVAVLQKELQIFSLKEYRAVLGAWLAALLTYGGLTLAFHHWYAGGFACAVYCSFLLFVEKQQSKTPFFRPSRRHGGN